MPVTAVTSNLFNINKKQNKEVNYTSNVQIKSNISQNNNLMDMNYGHLLVKSRPISFKGMSSVQIPDLTKKVSVIYNCMQDDQLLLIGKDFETARRALEKPIRKIRDCISGIFFIKDESFGSSVVIKKNSRVQGFDELINLEENKVYYKRRDDRDLLDMNCLDEGEKIRLQHADYISTKDPEYGFYLDTKESECFTDLPYESVEYVDLSTDIERDIAELNLKNLKGLKSAYAKEPDKIMFKDVGGQDAAVADLKRKVTFQVKYPHFFRDNINQRGHGALLVGPPGTGKSLAAEATANEANVMFFNINPQYLKGMWLGESEKNIQKEFDKYRANQPCIVFYDEANAIFVKRTGNQANVHTESQSELFYDEMSQLEKEGARVYFMGATNHPELMDEAALRRFDTKIEFTSLDTPERCKAVFDIHTRKTKIKNFNSDEFMKKLVKEDFSGDDIANLVVKAQLNAAERLGIFEKMGKDKYKDNPRFRMTLSGEDFDKALAEMIDKKKMLKKYEKSSKAERAKEIKTDVKARMDAEATYATSPGYAQKRKGQLVKEIELRHDAEKTVRENAEKTDNRRKIGFEEPEKQ